MFAEPSDSGPDRPRLVHDRRGIDADLRFDVVGERCNKRLKFAEFLPHHVVVIVAPCVARDLACSRLASMRMRREIVERDDDDGPCRRKKNGRIGAFLGLAFKPSHLAVKSAREPLFEPRAFFRKRPHADDADLVKADFESHVPDPFRQRSSHCHLQDATIFDAKRRARINYTIAPITKTLGYGIGNQLRPKRAGTR